ncbi:MAG: hypothetical protein QOE90_2454 [Thermoplasmata archaeon]|jgi:predicted nucleic acid-binding protein|nr:hypothetical protein [Thermoplasmata archaeon]
MRIVLDTGVFFRPAVLRELAAAEDADVVVPAVVLAERRRQLALAGRRPEELLEILEGNGFAIEPLGRDEAMRVPLADDARWRRHARDALIASHVGPVDVLWTTNPRDFLAFGLAPAQVRGV